VVVATVVVVSTVVVATVVVVSTVVVATVVVGVSEDSDSNAVSVDAPPHAARRPPARMIATNLFI
jgi:hypothetical protein